MEYLFRCASPLGPVTLASDGERLTGLWFDGQAHFGGAPGPERAEKDLPVFRETGRWLELYFRGGRPDFTPALRLSGTPFQVRIWERLLEIPYGQTVTYGQLAAFLGSSARAVGGAVGRNPVSIIVPCHRVLGADGRLTGYAGGVARKRALLALEGAAFSE